MSRTRFSDRIRYGLPIGTTVYHRLLGKGAITNIWGSWDACAECYAPIWDGCRCLDRTYHRISGHGIYDVIFSDGLSRSINGHWLGLEETSTGGIEAMAAFQEKDSG